MQHTVWLGLFTLFLSGCAPDPELMQRHERSNSRVQAAAISNDGRFSLIATNEEGLRLYDHQTGQLLHNWQQDDEGISQIVSVDFSHDGGTAIAASRMTIVLWNTATGEVKGAWRNDDGVILDVAVANSGRAVAIARSDGVVLLFEPQTGRRLEFLGHRDRVNTVDISPNGRYVLSGGNDHQAFLWGTRDGQIVHHFPIEQRVIRVRLHPGGEFALVSSAVEAQIRRLTTGEIHTHLNYHVRQKVFSSAAFSPDGRWLVTGSPSRQVELWSVQNGDRLTFWRVQGRPGDHPPRAAILSTSFASENTIAIETSAGYGELWRIPDQLMKRED
ncbi:MAG: hypothetical protein JJU10_01025 [Idiomarina sp.]|nr:hypothetical protein [Idiomarina sp.]